MPKTKIYYICTNCEYESLKWAGKCPACGQWNSFEEKLSETKIVRLPKQENIRPPVLLPEITELDESAIQTGITELDRVLGGGIYHAAVTLVAGDPGIGKSTLLLQVAGMLIQRRHKVLYVTGEESLAQIKVRAQRLRLAQTPIPFLVETNLENIIYQIEQVKPKVVIIDSIQSIFSENINGAPGNVGQVRECAFTLIRLAKENNIALFFIGHITKEGSIAGPKVLEHMVDVVIYFEGDTFHHYRILRSLKNRCGRTNEIGVFIMEMDGLKEIDNPSDLFLSGDTRMPVGTSVVSIFEGSRPILVEIQALVSRSNYGIPQRTVSGIEQARLALILAILEKHCGIHFGLNDVFIKVAGGLKLSDPGIDLGIAMSIYSSYSNKPLPEKSVYIGEIGLNGDIRSVSQMDRRREEAAKLGYKNIFLPGKKFSENPSDSQKDIRLNFIAHITDVISGRKELRK
jgi:DNA repair protein RadA/Sms